MSSKPLVIESHIGYVAASEILSELFYFTPIRLQKFPRRVRDNNIKVGRMRWALSEGVTHNELAFHIEPVHSQFVEPLLSDSKASISDIPELEAPRAPWQVKLSPSIHQPREEATITAKRVDDTDFLSAITGRGKRTCHGACELAAYRLAGVITTRGLFYEVIGCRCTGCTDVVEMEHVFSKL